MVNYFLKYNKEKNIFIPRREFAHIGINFAIGLDYYNDDFLDWDFVEYKDDSTKFQSNLIDTSINYINLDNCVIEKNLIHEIDDDLISMTIANNSFFGAWLPSFYIIINLKKFKKKL